MSDKTYDTLKLISMVIGYLATFILTLSDIWGFEMGNELAASVSAAAVLLGSILTAANQRFFETHGIVEIDDQDDDGGDVEDE